MTKTNHIAMWSGPRNISTTIMRSFENRADTSVIDEPFYASYLARSGANHPFRSEILASQPNDYQGALAWTLADNQDGTKFKFHKHIAFHLEPDIALDWLLETRCFLLIRDPRAMVASYANRFEDVTPIIASFRLECRIADFMTHHKKSCPIVDAKDILTAPGTMMRKLCEEIDIPFNDAMLAWPAGKRKSDGVWAPHWYQAVESSKGFRAFEEKFYDLTSELQEVADACRSDFEFLHEQRLRP